jgi:hypothetical protein
VNEAIAPELRRSSFESLLLFALNAERLDEDHAPHTPISMSSVSSFSSFSSLSSSSSSLREEESTERMFSARKKAREVDESEMPPELQAFVNCFKRDGSDKVGGCNWNPWVSHLFVCFLLAKIPKPIKRLVEWFLDNRDKMWISRSADGHLELTYDRPQLIRFFTGQFANHVETARKTVQNFERCLNSVKPKLIVLESTHGKDVKRIGFASPETIFGTERSSLSQKVERQLSRRAKKLKVDMDDF